MIVEAKAGGKKRSNLDPMETFRLSPGFVRFRCPKIQRSGMKEHELAQGYTHCGSAGRLLSHVAWYLGVDRYFKQQFD